MLYIFLIIQLFLEFLIIPIPIHDINNTTTINKLSSFLWYNFHTRDSDIPMKIINFLHLKILTNQMCVHLWSCFSYFLFFMFSLFCLLKLILGYDTIWQSMRKFLWAVWSVSTFPHMDKEETFLSWKLHIDMVWIFYTFSLDLKIWT